jgi:DNA polymerase III subunit delta'
LVNQDTQQQPTQDLLPWLRAPLKLALQTCRSHAVLVHGPEGVGQWELALSLAQAWLCEADDVDTRFKPCGKCPSCHLVQTHHHPDLRLIVPQALCEPLGLSLETNDTGESARAEKTSKTKPSAEIKVDALRAAVAFAQTTSARGRAKVVVVHPAQQMNLIAANTLLKTLEEPPGHARFILSCASPHILLPTLRSRCQPLGLHRPEKSAALSWLTSQGLKQAEVLLQASGGQPLTARAWAQDGLSAEAWQTLPEQVYLGHTAAFSHWALPRLVDALQRLCFDVLCVINHTEPRYFESDAIKKALPAKPQALMLSGLTQWARDLRRCARHVSHPWQAGLMTEVLIQGASRALRDEREHNH